jgi:acyl-CoA reductase-like NAD-dependent aldehyde dehydrogenase
MRGDGGPLMQPIFIDGAWVEASTRSALAVSNPATAKPLGSVPDCGAADVARAVCAARDARTGWRRLPARDRAAVLAAIAVRIRENHRELAGCLTRESGKPVCEAFDCVAAAAALFDRAAIAADDPNDDVHPLRESGSDCVTAALPDSYFPILGASVIVARALAAGHAVVLKAATRAPLSSLKLAEACEPLPPGVLNVVTGGGETGRALLIHPDIARVGVSGSPRRASVIASHTRGRPLDLFTGKRSAFIVCGDADLEHAVPSIAWERLANAGQSGGSAQHLYVDRSIIEEFTQRMHPCMGFLDVDDPAKLPTDLGPLISLDAANRVEDQVGRTLRAGARLILGGRRFRPSGLAGHFFQPTLLTNVKAGGPPALEEIQGPVVTITPVSNLAEALRLVSGSGCAGASIHGRAAAILETLEPETSGSFRINDPDVAAKSGVPPLGLGLPAGVREALETAFPFPGQRESGVCGRRVDVAPSLTVKPWWFPYLERNRKSG